MNLSSRLKHEWKFAGIIERMSWVIGLGAPIMSVLVWFYGFITKSDIFILLSAIFFITILTIIFLNISMRHERDKAKQDLIREKDNSANKLEKVYLHKNKETSDLEKLNADLTSSLDVSKQRIKELTADNQWLCDKYQIYEPLIDGLKETTIKPISASIILKPTSPDEVRFGEIQESLKKI